MMQLALVFEREELDGRKHSDWILEIELQQEGDTCRVAMHMVIRRKFVDCGCVGSRACVSYRCWKIRLSAVGLSGVTE